VSRSDGKALHRLGLAAQYLVRPDGYIAYRAGSTDITGWHATSAAGCANRQPLRASRSNRWASAAASQLPVPGLAALIYREPGHGQRSAWPVL
jgi:hypothetical protein